MSIALLGQPDSAPAGVLMATTATATKKSLVRRTGHDHSQQLRRGFQFGFLLLNLYLGTLFYYWVRQFETGEPIRLTRPAGVEGWLPIAGMMNSKYWLSTGQLPAVHPAAMFLFLAFLVISFLFRKAFCSWLCPVGTLSEYLWRGGSSLVRQKAHPPRWLDLPLRGLKYLLFGFFLWAISSMSAEAIEEFMQSPYGIIADVKMLNFFRHIGETGLIVLGVLVIASVFVQNFWCRYLCPYGALLGLAAMLGPLRLRRSPDACIDCAKCARVCPSLLPVDKLLSIKSAECTACLECVAACPAEDALRLTAPGWIPKGPRRLSAWALATGVAMIFLGFVGAAKLAGHWNSTIPRSAYVELVPRANQASHPILEK